MYPGHPQGGRGGSGSGKAYLHVPQPVLTFGRLARVRLVLRVRVRFGIANDVGVGCAFAGFCMTGFSLPMTGLGLTFAITGGNGLPQDRG